MIITSVCSFLLNSVYMILNLKVQGWSDLGVSRRTAAQDGLSGTLGLQQGKGMFLHFCVFAFPYFFNCTFMCLHVYAFNLQVWSIDGGLEEYRKMVEKEMILS